MPLLSTLDFLCSEEANKPANSNQPCVHPSLPPLTHSQASPDFDRCNNEITKCITIGPAGHTWHAQLVTIPYHGWWPVGLWLLAPARICQSTSRCRYAYYNMYSDLHPTSYLPALAQLVFNRFDVKLVPQ